MRMFRSFLGAALLIPLFSACQSTAPQQLKDEPRGTEAVQKIDSVEVLERFIEEGKQSGYFPSRILAQPVIGPEKLQEITLDFRKLIRWEADSKCPDHEDEIILAPGNTHRAITCNAGDTAIISGSGNDWIEDATGNDIIIAGAGDDTIRSGRGSDIFIFEEQWGHDSLTFDAHTVDTGKILGYDGSYPWKHASFLIFGKNIFRKDIQWRDDHTLVNLKTGDTITLSSRNINILFAEDPRPEGADPDFIAQEQQPRTVALEDFTAESALVEGKSVYLANGDEGLFIINAEAPHPLLLSKTVLPGKATALQLEEGIAYVAQSDTGYVGKRGWISIIDVKNPQQPRVLTHLKFGNGIYSVALHDHLLYFSDCHSRDDNACTLRIYDVSNPERPKSVSQTPLEQYNQQVLYRDGALYLSSVWDGFGVFDVSDPKRPKKTLQHQHLGIKPHWVIKTAKNRLIVNCGDNIVSVYKPTRDKKVIPLCDITTIGPKTLAGAIGFGSLAVRGDLVYKAEGPKGVSVSDIESCQMVGSIPFEGYYVTSLYLVGDTLVAMNPSRKESRVYRLDGEKTEDPAAVEKAVKRSEAPKKNFYAGLGREQLQSLLNKAAVKNDVLTIVELCNAGGDPNARGHERYTPIQISARLGNVDALEALLEHGGKADGKSMMLAALTGQMMAMKLLEQHGGNIAQIGDDGCSTLHYIAEDGTAEMVQYLVEHGVPINGSCRRGETPLTWAKFKKNVEVIRYLEQMGGR